MTVPDRLTISDIADLAGVGVSAVSNWRKRYSDFPVGRDDFDSGEVAGWLSKRKVPAKGLQPGEPVGTSYGDRLRARHGGPAARVSEEALAPQLAPVLTRLRGLGDPVQHIAFLLGLLWLRRDDSRRWHDIVGESESERVRDRVLAARLPAGRGPVAPVIPDGITSDASLLQTVRGFAAVAVPDPATATRLHRLLLRQLDTNRIHMTPAGLAWCMTELVRPAAGDLIHDPYCVAGEFFPAVLKFLNHQGVRPTEVRCTGQAPVRAARQLAVANTALWRIPADLGLRPSDALADAAGFRPRHNVVLVNPPFGRSDWGDPAAAQWRWPFGVPPRGSADFAWLQHAQSTLLPGGRAAVLTTNAATFKSGVEEEIRAQMVRSGVVDCVIAMPPGLFPSTGLSVTVWILRGARDEVPTRTLLIDATGLGVVDGSGQRVLTEQDCARVAGEYHRWLDASDGAAYSDVEGFSRSVDHREIRGNGHRLDPPRYLRIVRESAQAAGDRICTTCAKITRLRSTLAEVDPVVESQLSTAAVPRMGEVEEIQLGEVCDVLSGPGKVIRSEDGTDDGVPVVLPRNIGRGVILDENIETVTSATADKLVRYRLADGDVVCPRTGTLARYGLVRPGQAGWILGPSCMRIRPHPGVDPRYLTSYLNASVAVRWVEARASAAAVIQHISATTMGELPLALPPLDRSCCNSL